MLCSDGENYGGVQFTINSFKGHMLGSRFTLGGRIVIHFGNPLLTFYGIEVQFGEGTD